MVWDQERSASRHSNSGLLKLNGAIPLFHQTTNIVIQSQWIQCVHVSCYNKLFMQSTIICIEEYLGIYRVRAARCNLKRQRLEEIRLVSVCPIGHGYLFLNPWCKRFLLLTQQCFFLVQSHCYLCQKIKNRFWTRLSLGSNQKSNWLRGKRVSAQTMTCSWDQSYLLTPQLQYRIGL